MSGGPVAAREALAVACESVQGVVVVRRPGVQFAPPAVYFPLPTLSWDGYEPEPTEAVFEVVLAVAATERAIEQLEELRPLVTAALDESTADAVVKTAEPGLWRSGNTELPCYFIRIEAAI